LVAENDFGCSDTALLQIEPLNEGVFYVPNTFTPDGDQFNSVFMPVISDDFDRENYLFEIYNRWGELLFSTTEVTEGWTGTFNGLSCKTDTYTWKLTLKSTRNELNRVITGHVNLLR
jgi:gliding motility-associated-like protein